MTSSNTPPRAYTPGVPDGINSPARTSAVRYSTYGSVDPMPGSGVALVVMALVVPVNEQHRGTCPENAVVVDHDPGAVGIAQVALDAVLRIRLVSHDAADGHGLRGDL